MIFSKKKGILKQIIYYHVGKYDFFKVYINSK